MLPKLICSFHLTFTMPKRLITDLDRMNFKLIWKNTGSKQAKVKYIYLGQEKGRRTQSIFIKT